MKIYIMRKPPPDDPNSGKYYIEEYMEIEKNHRDFIVNPENECGAYKKDYLRNILIVNYKGILYLSKKRKYKMEFAPKSDFISGKQAKKNRELENARNRKIRDNQEMEKIDIDFEKERKKISNKYSFVVEGGMVRYNSQIFGKKVLESKNHIGNTTWKTDVGE